MDLLLEMGGMVTQGSLKDLVLTVFLVGSTGSTVRKVLVRQGFNGFEGFDDGLLGSLR